MSSGTTGRPQRAGRNKSLTFSQLRAEPAQPCPDLVGPATSRKSSPKIHWTERSELPHLSFDRNPYYRQVFKNGRISLEELTETTTADSDGTAREISELLDALETYVRSLDQSIRVSDDPSVVLAANGTALRRLSSLVKYSDSVLQRYLPSDESKHIEPSAFHVQHMLQESVSHAGELLTALRSELDVVRRFAPPDSEYRQRSVAIEERVKRLEKYLSRVPLLDQD